jgi:hypothetical protein
LIAEGDTAFHHQSRRHSLKIALRDFGLLSFCLGGAQRRR